MPKSLKAWPSYTKEELDSVSRVLSSNNVNYLFGNHESYLKKNFQNSQTTSFPLPSQMDLSH